MCWSGLRMGRIGCTRIHWHAGPASAHARISQAVATWHNVAPRPQAPPARRPPAPYNAEEAVPVERPGPSPASQGGGPFILAREGDKLRRVIQSFQAA